MTTSLSSIVIGTSLGKSSDDVVRAGVALARQTGASPWLIHSYSPLLFTYGTGMEAEWIVQQENNLRELLIGQAERTGLSALAGFTLDQVHLTMGSPHLEIVDLAQRVQAGLVIIGATESNHEILGSTADRVIRKSRCPVLVLRSAASFPPARVEIPVDLSPISANALRQGLDLLAQTGKPPAEIEVLFVLNPLEVGGSIHFTSEQIQRFADEELSRFVVENTPEGARQGSTRVRMGYPREEILAVLAERSADLVVLGTHGRSGFERLMIGSVASGALRGASCNLLIVPPAASQQNEATAQPGDERAGADWSFAETAITAR